MNIPLETQITQIHYADNNNQHLAAYIHAGITQWLSHLDHSQMHVKIIWKNTRISADIERPQVRTTNTAML